MPKKTEKGGKADPRDILADVVREQGGDSLAADAFMAEKCRIIGGNIRYERKKRKLSIDVLAEYIELSASYVGLLERGDRCPSLRSLLKLCDMFNVEPNALLLKRDESLTLAERTGGNYYASLLTLINGLGVNELEYLCAVAMAFRKYKRLDETNPTETANSVNAINYDEKINPNKKD